MGDEDKPVSGLKALLSGMEPALSEGKFYFAPVGEDQLMALANYLDNITGIFREDEGLTVVFSEDILDDMSELADKPAVGPFALITLKVHSDLMAVGFLARIAEALAIKGISVNAVSAYHHDHLLVPYGKKDSAMKALRELSRQGR